MSFRNSGTDLNLEGETAVVYRYITHLHCLAYKPAFIAPR